MCGLVGIAGEINGTHEKLLRMLLILDVFRGEDSTGVAAVRKYNAEVLVAKTLGDPFNLFNDGKWDKIMRGVNRVLIGHNRYATSGGVSKAGAHPFDFDTLVGAHNGTLGSRWRLDDDKDFKVDSEALYHNIEKNGLKETIRRLGAAGNAWSLTWWDKEAETLNFLRNKERPMFMCQTEDGKVLAWASEYWMLDAAFMRLGIKRGPIVMTEEDQHISIHVDNKGVLHKPHMAQVSAEPVVYLPQQQNTTYRKPPHVDLKPTTTTQTSNPSNVVSLPAPKGVDVSKKDEAGNGKGLASDPSYLRAKSVKFEILKACTDGNGGKYLSLFDPNEPLIDIRLYPHRLDSDILNMEGAELTGDINSWGKEDDSALRPYYKVNPWNVRLVPDKLINPALIFDGEEEEMTVMDHKGKLITESEFHKTYNACGWCSEKLSILNKNRYTTTGDCLCPDCSKNEEVIKYVNVI